MMITEFQDLPENDNVENENDTNNLKRDKYVNSGTHVIQDKLLILIKYIYTVLIPIS